MSFHVINQNTARALLEQSYHVVEEHVKTTYLDHARGNTNNPESVFLRFKNNPSARIIALPASIDTSEFSMSGIKWIASYPENIKHNKQRASAVLLLNDSQTGYPLACLESSVISAHRTAACATLGAYYLSGKQRSAKTIGIVGTGFIARTILDFLIKTGWHFETLHLYDQSQETLDIFASYGEEKYHLKSQQHTTPESLCSTSDLIFFATTSQKPYLTDKACLAHHPIILHISLRDLGEEIILDAFNLVDDLAHSLKAETSTHLAFLKQQDKNFIQGTLADLMAGTIPPPPQNKTKIFSPFGMGILDVRIGAFVLDQAISQAKTTELKDFFSETNRF